ncbi:hypothetical protein [Pseudonocardia sp. NPDC049635]|uniref:hypothetical protein n=1 Tax=Pseudonocardia sp. NPDC049635 TaxID=3155506 RepID=UPI0033FDCC28
MTAVDLPVLPPRVSADDIRSALALYRFAILDEHRLHRTLEGILDDRGVRYQREHSLRDARNGKAVGRIDFLTEDGIGIEVKVKGTPVDVARQLRRYASSGVLRELLLVTTVRRHAQDIPTMVGNVPVTFAVLGGGF